MEYFLDTVETIPEGVGFPYFGPLHLTWLAVFVVFTALSCVGYRRAGEGTRRTMQWVFVALLLADELWKWFWLIYGGNVLPKYLPLHLCSINIFLAAVHAVWPSRTLGNFMYMACVPGAIAALLFPTWVSLPLGNFMHLHSFTVHTLLAAYPLMLVAGGTIRPRVRQIPKCLAFLGALAIPIYGVNLLLDTNFMFLMYPEPGNPLFWFEATFGNHLIGYPFLIAAVLAVMYLPVWIVDKRRVPAEA